MNRDQLRAAVAVANVPTMLMVLVQLTGELRWLEEPYRPGRTRGLGDNDTGGLDAPVQDEIRAAALDAILAWQAGRPVAIPEPDPELLVRMVAVSMGDPVPPEYAPLMAHELAHGTAAPASEPPVDAPAGFRVLVIGAGVSGLCAAVRLGEAGIPYTVIERNDTVGGTWLENRYPGCGVDTPSHLYSYSFAPADWPHYFATRDEVFGYLERVATDHDVWPHVEFGSEVVGAGYEPHRQRWAVQVRDAAGRVRTEHADVVISAVGAFNKPRTPDLPGLADFRGAVAHTARWPDGLDLTGRRVAVIGNGASAMQLVPAVADEAKSVTVFQRSPQWVAPFEQFHLPVPDPVRQLLRAVPLYRAWYRMRLTWTFNDKIHGALQKDPAWPHPDRSVSEVNEAHRSFFTRHMVTELGDRQDLLDDVLPDYPPFGKRMLLDNGWFRALTRDDVHLVRDPIDAVTPDGVRTGTGTVHEADVLVLATGFDVVRFLAPMDIRGRSGAALREVWDDDDARAYMGTAVPDFPNFFCLYGPNTQAGHGGSLIFYMEMQMHYVMSLVRPIAAGAAGAVEVRPEVYDRWGTEVDAAHERMIWTHEGMDTYYRNPRGRVVVINPFRVIDYWAMTRRADLDEYVVEPQAGPAEAS